MAHICNPNALEAEIKDCQEFQTSLVIRVRAYFKTNKTDYKYS